MLAMTSLVNSVGTAVFVLGRAQWRLAHNVAMVSLHLASFGAAWALGLSLEAYLVLVSALLTLELGIYLALLDHRRPAPASEKRFDVTTAAPGSRPSPSPLTSLLYRDWTMESATQSSPAAGDERCHSGAAASQFSKRVSAIFCIFASCGPSFPSSSGSGHGSSTRCSGSGTTGCSYLPDVMITSYDGLTLGRNVSINRGCHLSCAGGLSIGDDVAIGHNTSILTTEHGYRDVDVPIKNQPVDLHRSVSATTSGSAPGS